MAGRVMPAFLNPRTYSKSNVPLLGALIDYIEISLVYLRTKTFTEAEKLHAKTTKATLSASFLAVVCLLLGVACNVKFEVVTMNEEPLPKDLHLMVMSKSDKLYIDDIDASTSLKAAAPDGVDIYFDNVGGEISSLIINQMRDYGRVAVCGSISSYNEDPTKFPKANIIQPSVEDQLKIEGFMAWSWFDRWSEAFPEIIKWINSGELKPQEHVTEGFDKIFDAFVGMLNGENVGKAVVKI